MARSSKRRPAVAGGRGGGRTARPFDNDDFRILHKFFSNRPDSDHDATMPAAQHTQPIIHPRRSPANSPSPSSLFCREFEQGITSSKEPCLDAFDQWAALVRHEGRGAYAIRGPVSTDKDTKSREDLCLWCYRVVDRFGLGRAPVAVALSYFDRAVSTSLVEDEEHTIALITCLYIALKVCFNAMHEIDSSGRIGRLGEGYRINILTTLLMHERMTECGLHRASNDTDNIRGEDLGHHLVEQDILAMERHICEGLDWFLNPPVADNYINVIAGLLTHERVTKCGPNQASNDIRREEVRRLLVGQSRYLCERCVLDAFFSDKRPSSVAYAAVLVAMDLMSFPGRPIEWFLSLPLECDVDEKNLCVLRLRAICKSEDYRPALKFDCCVGRASEDKENEGIRVQVVSPMQGEVSPIVKRVHQEAAVNFCCRKGNAEGGTVITSPKMRRCLKTRSPRRRLITLTL